MSDLEEEGLLYQPHTSAGRVPTAAAYRFFVQEIAAGSATVPAELPSEDQKYIRDELEAASTPDEVMERASHVLATLSQGLGIVLSPPLSKVVLEHIRFLSLPDGRVLIVLIAKSGIARDKIVRLERALTQSDLDHTAEFLNRQFVGWTLDAIRAQLAQQLTEERARYDQLLQDVLNNAVILCDPKVLGVEEPPQMYVEGAAQITSAPEFTDQNRVRELLEAIEEKSRLVALLTGCIEAPEPVQVQIGIKEISDAGEHLALITAPYSLDRAQGSLGVLGPMRMQYERAITTVAFVAKLFSKQMSGAD
jgi:heat-inducible transcriptional repressor